MDERYDAAEQLKKELSTAVHDPTEPTWAFRMKDGEVESKVFPAKDVPEGWYDSPAHIPKEPVGIVAETDGHKITPRKPGRPRKVRDDDSA